MILTRAVASRELVARRCEVAAAAGVKEGMDLAHARSLVPPRVRVYVEPHRPERDAAALNKLACWATRFSPMVAPSSSEVADGLFIDIAGTERLHKSESTLICAVALGVWRLGFSTRVAGASTFGCAWGVARFGRHNLSLVPCGRERDALEHLPVAALRVNDEAVLGLNEIGITTAGQILALPRASLASRFDPVLVHRVRQALGEVGEPIELVRPAPPLMSEMIFDGPTDRWESIEAAAKQVLEQLVADLTRQERGVRRLDVRLLRTHAPVTEFDITLSRPSRSVKHLWSLLRTRLERVDLGEGIAGVTLIALRTARLRHEQVSSTSLGASEEQIAQQAWGELVDTLVGRLGADNVVMMEPVESHLPERAFRERSVMEVVTRKVATAATVTNADRPTRLFTKPEPAAAVALTPDGPIYTLGWRGRQFNVLSCSRPERIGAEWWRWSPKSEKKDDEECDLQTSQHTRRVRKRVVSTVPEPPPDRDYFVVQTEHGRWLWVCRQVDTGRWFVHGEWS